MELNEIQERVNALGASMLDKGMRSPQATVMLKNHGNPTLHLAWADKSQRYGESYDSFAANTLPEAFALAEQFVSERPSPEQAKLQEFMGALGKVIDLGKESAIEVDFLNPLVETMKRLSKNALTDQRAA